MIVTRDAVDSDVDAIVELGDLLWLELGYSDVLEYDEDSVRLTCENLKNNHVLIVSEDEDGDILGFMGGVIQPVYFNMNYKSLSELFWWVESSHRDKGIGVELLRFFEDKAIELGCRFVCPMLHLTATGKKAGELMETYNYKAVEKVYIKEVPWAVSVQ